MWHESSRGWRSRQRPREIQRHRRDQLKDVLRNRLPVPHRQQLRTRHHSVHLCLLHAIAIPPVHWCSRDVRADPSSVPYTSDIVPRYDLSKSPSLYVPDLNESTVKEQDIWRMQRYSLGSAYRRRLQILEMNGVREGSISGGTKGVPS